MAQESERRINLFQSTVKIIFAFPTLFLLHIMIKRARRILNSTIAELDHHEKAASQETDNKPASVPNPIRKSSFRVNFSPLILLKKRFLKLVTTFYIIGIAQAFGLLIEALVTLFYQALNRQYQYLLFKYVVLSVILNSVSLISELLLFFTFYYLALLFYYGKLEFKNERKLHRIVLAVGILHANIFLSFYFTEFFYRVFYCNQTFQRFRSDINDYDQTDYETHSKQARKTIHFIESWRCVLTSASLSVLGFFFVLVGKKLESQDFFLPITKSAKNRISGYAVLIGSILLPIVIFAIFAATAENWIKVLVNSTVVAVLEICPTFLLLKLASDSDSILASVADPIPKRVLSFGE